MEGIITEFVVRWQPCRLSSTTLRRHSAVWSSVWNGYI